jgi:hypothetical protein
MSSLLSLFLTFFFSIKFHSNIIILLPKMKKFRTRNKERQVKNKGNINQLKVKFSLQSITKRDSHYHKSSYEKKKEKLRGRCCHSTTSKPATVPPQEKRGNKEAGFF